MAQALPQSPVPAPPARPPRYGLLVAAPPFPIDDPQALAAGWSFQPEGCGLSGIDSPDCVNGAVMSAGSQPGIVSGRPFQVWAVDECSTFGFLAREWQGRVRRQLEATQSHHVAAELWDGAIEAVDNNGNRYLAEAASSSDSVTNGPSSVGTAVACVEAALASYLYGAQGMVHMPPQLLAHAVTLGAVARDGQVWVTPMGHVVVADSGYSGSGPGGDPATGGLWMYGTPMIQVALGPVQVVPDTLDEARGRAQAMDRSVNDIAAYAWRLAAYRWSNECAHVAAQTNIPSCLIGGTS